MAKKLPALDTIVDFFLNESLESVTTTFRVVQAILRVRGLLPKIGRPVKPDAPPAEGDFEGLTDDKV